MVDKRNSGTGDGRCTYIACDWLTSLHLKSDEQILRLSDVVKLVNGTGFLDRYFKHE